MNDSQIDPTDPETTLGDVMGAITGRLAERMDDPATAEKLRQVPEKYLSDEHLAITDPEEIMQAVAVFCGATQGTRGAGMPLPQQNALELLAMPTVVDSPAPYIDSNVTS